MGINLANNILKSEVVKKNLMMQNEGICDGEDVDYPSKTNILGELQINDGVLKLNEKKK